VKDAEAAGDDIAATLRLRIQRHESLEHMAHGGFESDPWADVLRFLKATGEYLVDEDWHVYSQRLVTARTISELANTSTSGTHWQEFKDLIVPWLLAADGKGPHRWLPLSPAIRSLRCDMSEKLATFTECICKHVITPMIAQGTGSLNELLSFLTEFQHMVENAPSTDEVNAEDQDDVLELVGRRVRGTAAFVSREYGFFRQHSLRRQGVAVRGKRRHVRYL
jgi:hypothetical protein